MLLFVSICRYYTFVLLYTVLTLALYSPLQSPFYPVAGPLPSTNHAILEAKCYFVIIDDETVTMAEST